MKLLECFSFNVNLNEVRQNKGLLDLTALILLNLQTSCARNDQAVILRYCLCSM